MDVAIAGGGLIGLASALELARRGLRVTVVDAGEPGQASWAAAGILGPQSEAHEPSPLVELCVRSYELYPEFVQSLDADVGLRRNGTLHVAFSDAEAHELRARQAWQSQRGLRIEERSHPGAALALFFPDEGQVDNRKLHQALGAACAKAGVAFEQRKLRSLDELKATRKVLCAGSWARALAEVPVFPQKGQLVLLDAAPPAQVIFGGGGYAVPRGGRTIVGATGEDAGFDTLPTTEGRAVLLGIAARLGYADPPIVDHWAGLRPATADGLPYFDKLPDKTVVAAGHFRNGVLLTPISARIVAALVCEETPPVDLLPFSLARR
ncbi:MAG TPA: FAD-dependent oxidoreductase [Myxococcales bacterium]|jgi:glycine oxidase